MTKNKTYIGCKIILASPMSEYDFNTQHDRKLIQLEKNRPGYQVTYPDGYVSWSPKNTFEIAYREIT